VAASYTLNELSEATAIEGRTIRSYIERGLLPGADSRGRGATYSAGHLARLKVIQALRRARPNLGLSEIRISLQLLTPTQIERLSQGSISAVVQETQIEADQQAGQTIEIPPDGDPENTDWDEASKTLTGVERLV
jgi:DNA-binding transcriptional MerR regulator